MKASGLLIFAALLAAPVGLQLSGSDVLLHLNETIAWYQRIAAVDLSTSSPQDILLQDSVRQTSRQVMKLAFDFAKAEASYLAKLKNPAANSARSDQPADSALSKALSEANDRVAKLQAQISDLDAKLDKATGRSRATLTSQREALTADLELAKDFQQAVHTTSSFSTGTETTQSSGSLLGQISLLAQSDSVPAALNQGSPPPAPGILRAAPPAEFFSAESAGILALGTHAISLARDESQLGRLLKDAGALATEIDTLKKPLRSSLRGTITQGDQLAQSLDTQTDPAQVDTVRKQLDELAGGFKQLASVMTPLTEQGIVLANVRGQLSQWRDTIDARNKSILRFLAFRVGVLILGVAVVFLVSELVRRATFRYVRDARRRHHFIVLRRVIVGITVTILAALALFSGFGSFATVAGFVTAGLAVALQNVILAVVAHFFLIGRYGLRAGDRVTVGGITGEVLEVGLVRFYMLELAGSGGDMHSTGRVAVFSNAVIFQPSALIKQAPGTEFAWHAVALTLDCTGDFDAVRRRLTSAVESVYEEYRERIEKQHAAFERSVNAQLTVPKPSSRIQFTDSGCEVVVRFPVELSQSSEIDERIVKRLFEELNSEPKLKLASGGSPRIQPLA